MAKIIDDVITKLIITSIPNKEDLSSITYAIQMINADRPHFVSPYIAFLLANALCHLKSKEFGLTLTDEFYDSLNKTIQDVADALKT